MDNPGWHAMGRAQRDSFHEHPQRGPDGRFQPVEQVMPMNEGFIGGFRQNNHLWDKPPASPQAPTPPPKDDDYLISPNQSNGAPGYASPPSSPTVWSDPSRRGRPRDDSLTSHRTPSAMSRMSAVERSQNLRTVRMNPHLQFMAGPLLRYDTVDNGVWCGACMIVTVDGGSLYEPHPSLTYEWDPVLLQERSRTSSRRVHMSFDLAPHPADPYNVAPTANANGNAQHSSRFKREQVPGHEIWVYEGNGGTFTFWRFMIRVPLGEQEMSVRYSINGGQQLEFFVPGHNQNMRWAAYSCNGFSAGVNPDDFRGPGFKSGYDPVWTDLLEAHASVPFHALVGGGDQIYCDRLTNEPEFQEWITLPRPEMKKNYPLTEEIELAIDRFYFNHYCQIFRSGAFARANSSIPMINMADLIDGFGSYPEDLQMSPVFRTIGARGYFFFLLFQCFISVEVDGLDDQPQQHPFKSLIIGADGPYVRYPSHSFLTYLGPQCYMLLLDCRAERKKDQVCSPVEYEKVMARMNLLPTGVEHLVVLVGIPIAYPRMVFLEKALDSKFNPLTALGKKGSLGLSGFVNKFNAEAELLDDLNDHWTAKSHKKERNWFIQRLQAFALRKRIRVSFLSGDVHCAAVGCLKTFVKDKNSKAIPPAQDHRYMLNIVTSAIVNTPPPAAVLSMVSHLSTKVHKTLHHASTDEMMVPLFVKEPDGSPSKSKFIMGRRNWCSVLWDHTTGEMVFDIRVEKDKGQGTTIGYSIRTPPPQWTA